MSKSTRRLTLALGAIPTQGNTPGRRLYFLARGEQLRVREGFEALPLDERARITARETSRSARQAYRKTARGGSSPPRHRADETEGPGTPGGPIGS